MKPFHELTRLGQLRRIWRSVETALKSYELGEARLAFLRYFTNITYKVDGG